MMKRKKTEETLMNKTTKKIKRMKNFNNEEED